MKAYGLVAVIVLAAAVAGRAGQPYLGYDGADVVVVTVKKVSDHKATNGNPPRLVLEVHEVLRGDPKADRSRAVWIAAPHDHDTGGDDELRKAREAWEARPLAGPKVGDKFVLWGGLPGGGKAPEFRAYSYHAYPFSPEKRKWAIAVIKDGEERARREAARREVDKEALAKARADWRAKVSAEDLGRYAAQADIVAVGRVTSMGGATELRVMRFLKGRKRKGHDGDYVRVELPREVRPVLDREVEYLLFLTFTEKPAGVIYDYPRIKAGDGIVIADEAALAAVKKAIAGK